MAIQVMVEVWEHSEAEGSALLVMLALADRARSEDGVCWPGLDELASKARISQSQVCRHLAALESSGELRVVRQGGRGAKDTTVRQVAVGKYSRIDATLPESKSRTRSAKSRMQDGISPAPMRDEPTTEPSSRTVSGKHPRKGNRNPNGTQPEDDTPGQRANETGRGGWPARVAAIFAKHIGVRDPGECGRWLKPAVDQHGEEKVCAAVELWATESVSDGEKPHFLTPKACSQQIAVWVQRCEDVQVYVDDDPVKGFTPEFTRLMREVRR